MTQQFRAPGKLVLRSERLRGELAALGQAAPEPEADAAAATGAAKSTAGKGRKRAAAKVAGSSVDAVPGGSGKKAAGKAGAVASADQHVSKKQRKEKDADAGQLRGSSGARGNGHGEPHVLNRQQVQPERPAHHGSGWGRNSGTDPKGGGKTNQQRNLHARLGSGSGSEAGLKAGSPPPPVRWDIDVAAALGIGTGGGGAAQPGSSRGGHPGAPLRGVSPSAATSGAWASTSFGGGSLPPAAVLPSRDRGTAATHLQPMSRSLSAASAPGPGGGGGPPVAAHQQGVPRLKIKLRVPPGSQSAAGPPAGPASAGGSRRSSGSGGRSARTPYDDSWFAEHIGREPRLGFAIRDEAQVQSVCSDHPLSYARSQQL